MLPNFIVIGGQRCGTTWLDSQLRKHPQITMPADRKEVHFFDREYRRGLSWYQSLFRAPKSTAGGESIRYGEITPKYIFDPEVPGRMAKDLPHVKLVAILRNPADRAYSQYGLAVSLSGFKGTFQEFMATNKEAFARGLYAEQLERYLERFPREQLLVLVFENIMFDKTAAIEKIFGHLEVDSNLFPGIKDNVGKPQATVPKHALAYTVVQRIVRWLRYNNLHWIYNIGRSMGISKKLFGERALGEISPEEREELLLRYQADIDKLERKFDLDLSTWRRGDGQI